MTTPLTKAERLAIGGAVAPAVRRQAAAPRKVTVVDKDGRPVRETTSVEVAKAVLARSEIEFSVQEGKRPEWVTCKTCGSPVKVRTSGTVPTQCRQGTHVCGCGAPIRSPGCGFGRKCVACSRVAAAERLRNVDPALISARMKAFVATRSPEERKQRARRASLSRSPEMRKKHARHAAERSKAATTPEQRSAAARKASLSKTPEGKERSRIAALKALAEANARATSAERSEIAIAACARMTSEQLSERTRKANATRRARAAGASA